jgi:hypothetical protein
MWGVVPVNGVFVSVRIQYVGLGMVSHCFLKLPGKPVTNFPCENVHDQHWQEQYWTLQSTGNKHFGNEMYYFVMDPSKSRHAHKSKGKKS